MGAFISIVVDHPDPQNIPAFPSEFLWSLYLILVGLVTSSILIEVALFSNG